MIKLNLFKSIKRRKTPSHHYNLSINRLKLFLLASIHWEFIKIFIFKYTKKKSVKNLTEYILLCLYIYKNTIKKTLVK
jgi:hypothetical protein